MTSDYRDMVIEMLADDEAALKEANRQLVDLVADVAYENAVLRTAYEREHLQRIWGDAAIDRLQAALYKRDKRAA